jgi:hypothetical protein
MAGFYSPSGAVESYNSSVGGSAVNSAITIEGLSIKVGGTWYSVPSTNLPFTIDPTLVPGVLLDAIPVTIPAGTLVIGRVAYHVPALSSSWLPTTTMNFSAASIGTPEASQGSTSSLISKLTDGTSLTNSGAHADLYHPAYMVAQGGDGRPAFIIVGDSIGKGVNETASPILWSARNEIGFIARGLDDNTDTKRLAYGSLCIPGDAPTGSAGWNTRANWAMKLDAVKQVFDTYGAWPFDHVISEHGTNSLSEATYSSLQSGMASYFSLMKTEWSKPIIQAELLPRPASSDGFQTLANQSVLSGSYDYPNGKLWKLNADIGTDGVADATTYFRDNGYIDDSFAPWLQTSYDTGSNRDKLAIRPFNTTLASAYASGSTVSLTAAPTVGECIIFVSGGVVKFDAMVTGVSGTGPYTVTFVSLSTTAALNSGDVCQAAFHDKGGLHPSTIGHRDYYKTEVINWKKRRGWV